MTGCFTSIRMEGVKVAAKTKAMRMPIAASIPKIFIGFIDEVVKAINPVAVVREVKKIVNPISFIVFKTAFFREDVFFSSSEYFENMCIRSDIPTTSIRVGNRVLIILSGLCEIPRYP